MLDVIDILSERYGWAYYEVWRLPFADTLPLVKKARKGKLEDSLMMLSIVSNPHLNKASDSKKLPNNLMREIKRLTPRQAVSEEPQKDWIEALTKIKSRRNG